eukprot:12428599-Ditylum_brightwellii.AAC.1
MILKAPSGSNGTSRRISTTEARATVIGKMHDKDIQLIPASIDGWLCEGEAIKWFKIGNSKQKFDYSLYHFKGSIGVKEGMVMCSVTMDGTNLCGVLHKANKQWKQLNGNKHFGVAYTEQIPKDWATQVLAACNTWIFSHHIIWCLRKTQHWLQGQKVSLYLDMDPWFA